MSFVMPTRLCNPCSFQTVIVASLRSLNLNPINYTKCSEACFFCKKRTEAEDNRQPTTDFLHFIIVAAAKRSTSHQCIYSFESVLDSLGPRQLCVEKANNGDEKKDSQDCDPRRFRVRWRGTWVSCLMMTYPAS